MNHLHEKVLNKSGLLQDFTVQYGPTVVSAQELNAQETSTAPSVSYVVPKDAKLFTLMMFDPDVPQKGKEYLHWLIVDIKGNDLSTGRVLVPYEGPHPPPNSGIHRYIFTLLHQPEPFAGPIPSRTEFKFQEFFRQLGGPEFVDERGASWIEYETRFWIDTTVQKK